jgi:SPP1 gp7 family putative phage head morphogenesis protein
MSRTASNDTAPQGWHRARQTELRFSRELRKVAREIGRIVAGFDLNSPAAVARVRQSLDRYAEIIGPWAEHAVARIQADLDRADAKAWRRHAKSMSAALRAELDRADVRGAMNRLAADQVRLIKSLPTEAAERVHRLTQQGLTSGGRAKEVAAEIARTGEVTASRATMIARTETSRTATTLTETRATFVGSEGYIWRTSKDGDVRHSHKKMEGQFVRWDSPPELDGMVGHAGCFPHCRCYPEPVIPKELSR